MTTLLDAALAYLKAGLSVLPCTLPKKEPAFSLLPYNREKKRHEWDPFKVARASEDDARIWFSSAGKDMAIGVIGGKVSGNLEILDFDDPKLFTPWLKMLKGLAPGFHNRLVVERSLRGGVHVLYRCEMPVEGNLKLARGLRFDEEKQKEVPKTLIETRGESGYAVVSPTPGYVLKHGKIEEPPVITDEEREVMLAIARSLDELTVKVEGPSCRGGLSASDGNRPGDDYNRTGDVAGLLTDHGWTRCHSRGDVVTWRRPGKERGSISATWNFVPARFHVFSSNADPFESDRCYAPFAMYALLECGGDFVEASSRLRKAGFGFEDPLAGQRGREKERLEIEDGDEPLEVDGALAVLPDTHEREAPQEEDPEEDSGVVELPRPPDGFPRIPDKRVVELAMGGERGLGRLAADLFRDRFVFDGAGRSWYQWVGHYWAECRKNEEIAALGHLQALVRSVAVRKRPKKPPTIGKDGKERAPAGTGLFEGLMSAADSLKKLMTCKHVLEFAASGSDGLGIVGDEWDQEPWLLACRNGTVDLRTGVLRDGNPRDRLKTVCSVEYDQDAEADRFVRFIREIMPDEETARFLQRLLGYSVTGRIIEHVFPVFWGETGRNGKGTLFETLANVLGPLASPIGSKALISSNFQPEHDSAMLDLRGRRLVWASESGDRQPLDAAKVKLWTGGDTLKGRPPYGAYQIQFKPTHKLILITNYKPKVSSEDKAMWQRMLLVPFLETFVDDPKTEHQHKLDRTLPDQLKAEAQGILTWLVRGCQEWQRVGLQPPETVRGATRSYQSEEDVLGSFLSDCTAADPNERVRAKDLHDRYVTWCEACGEGKPMGSKGFAKALKARGLVAGHTRLGTTYPGIRLLSD